MSNHKDIPHIYKPLLPLAWLYSAGVWMRNRLFDRGILPVEEFSVPVISVGNLTVGGTGKTPHIEYLIELLLPHKRIAVLSRGYRRKSKGLVIATSNSTATDIGDEPLQILRKYPTVTVAVDSNRRRGIRQLLQQHPQPEVILLDDAHQHRYVHPTLSIVLCDYNRPIYVDLPLPAGRLREPMSGLKRADVVLITKCTHALTDNDLQQEGKLLHYPADKLYASHIAYGAPYNIKTKKSQDIATIATQHHIIIFTGIANPTPMIEYVSKYTSHITVQSYPDHHNFSKEEIRKLSQAALKEDAIILTTEKDVARMADMDIATEMAQRCYALPLKCVIQPATGKVEFDKLILQVAGVQA